MSLPDYPSAWLRPRSAASVSPGTIIVAPPTTGRANFRLRRDTAEDAEMKRVDQAGLSGNRTVNAVPTFNSLLTSMVPCSASTMALQMAKPRPT